MAVSTPTPMLKLWLNSLVHNTIVHNTIGSHGSEKGNCRAEERLVVSGVTGDKRLVNISRMCYFEKKMMFRSRARIRDADILCIFLL